MNGGFVVIWFFLGMMALFGWITDLYFILGFAFFIGFIVFIAHVGHYAFTKKEDKSKRDPRYRYD